MKSFMQIALATFGIMTLIFAGCAVPAEEDSVDDDTSAEIMIEETVPADDGDES